MQLNTKLNASITAVGGYVPEHRLSNKNLEQIVDTNDEWIQSRTGIKERRILKDPSKATSFLAIQASKNLISKMYGCRDMSVLKIRNPGGKDVF